jgi:hypothetical protein
MTLFTFDDVTSSSDELKERLERVRTLLYRLARVKDSSVEAELIAQLALETEAVSRLRAASGVNAEQKDPPVPARPVDRNTTVQPVARGRARQRTGRRIAGHG